MPCPTIIKKEEYIIRGLPFTIKGANKDMWTTEEQATKYLISVWRIITIKINNDPNKQNDRKKLKIFIDIGLK